MQYTVCVLRRYIDLRGKKMLPNPLSHPSWFEIASLSSTERKVHYPYGRGTFIFPLTLEQYLLTF